MDIQNLALFLIAALLLALTPGPGILFVAARALAGGRSEGLASTFGTAIGGLVHVAAGAIGVSALMLASAEAFTALKLVGAVYLIWLGIKMMREAKVDLVVDEVRTGWLGALRDGIVVEAFNPKTAAFFLAFIPQFVSPASGGVAGQFAVLGVLCVILNTGVDVLVVFAADRTRAVMAGRPGLMRKIRIGSGAVMCGLGGLLAIARRPT